MKPRINLIAATLAAAFNSPAALAQDSGFYLGGSFGQSKIRGKLRRRRCYLLR